MFDRFSHLPIPAVIIFAGVGFMLALVIVIIIANLLRGERVPAAYEASEWSADEDRQRQNVARQFRHDAAQRQNAAAARQEAWRRSPANPMNPNSPLNPANPMNPNSRLNPNNPLNPNSPLNPNNPANPNSPMQRHHRQMQHMQHMHRPYRH